jgi:tRNA (guanine-N7-)-methyltransferase
MEIVYTVSVEQPFANPPPSQGRPWHWRPPRETPGEFELLLDDSAGFLKLEQVFGRSAPLALEIGCGGGRTVIGMALTRLEWNFIGIEHAGEYYRMLRERVTRRRVANLRITRVDAAYLLHCFLPDASVREFHIYFPDPWPKKRHQKRRLFTEAFCADLRRTLAGDGVLYFATDHAEYYAELLPLLRAAFQVTEHPQPWEDAPLGRTNFEVKYMKEGRPIYRLVANMTGINPSY